VVPIEGLDHVQVAAPPGCEREAQRFYGELLGLDELPKPEVLAGRGGAWFSCGPQQLHVGIAEDFAAARKAHPALRVTDVAELERLAERLEHAGVEVRWDQDLPGARRFYADDPWGNRVELLAPAG
jgi:catechol 2,3-dioxygenase-like lactoylglutathione lyase family enzyme